MCTFHATVVTFLAVGHYILTGGVPVLGLFDLDPPPLSSVLFLDLIDDDALLLISQSSGDCFGNGGRFDFPELLFDGDSFIGAVGFASGTVSSSESISCSQCPHLIGN